jgi:hypothetical protein
MKRFPAFAFVVILSAFLVTSVTAARTEVVEVTGRITPDMNEFVFALDGYEDEFEDWRTKSITVKEGGKEIQTITISGVNDGEDASTPGKDTLELLIEDLNFDGFNDIRLQAFMPAGPNIPYICWLWDDGARQFVHSAELSDIPSIEVDAENEWLSSYERATPALYTNSFYKFTDGKPVLFKAVDELYSEDNPDEPEVSARYPSPGGERYVRETGNPAGAEVTFEVYEGEGNEKLGEINGIRGQVAWLDPVRFAVTRIDGTRSDEAPFVYRLSVVMFDTAAKETTVLKDATDTQNFSFRGEFTEDESAVVVTEETVKSKEDWGDEEKTETREINVEIPAAG